MAKINTTESAAPSAVRIEALAEADPTVIRIVGRLDVDTAVGVWDVALRALPKQGDAILDAAELDYCDGAGMSLIHDMSSRLRKSGGTLAVRGLSRDLQSFLDLTHLDEDLVVPAECPSRRSIPEIVGMHAASIAKDIGEILTYVGAIAASLGSALLRPHKVRWGDMLESCTTAGAFAFPVVTLIGFLLGWVLAFSSVFVMHDFGADQFLAALIGPAMVRELGPLITCIVLAARSGSAFAAEIGTMKVNEEVDALTTMGIDPVRFLVIPKVLASVCMTPLLAAFATAAGVIGGAVVSAFVIGQPLVIYTNLLQEKVTLSDVTLGLVKAALFGMIVASLGCIRGLQTGKSASAVGAATTSAVVTSIVFLAITDAIIAVIVQIIGV
tara:strand:- start:21328 stop:22479 length:1152 start_codon:yes stop_codon:yes gene_type:complete